MASMGGGYSGETEPLQACGKNVLEKVRGTAEGEEKYGESLSGRQSDRKQMPSYVRYSFQLCRLFRAITGRKQVSRGKQLTSGEKQERYRISEPELCLLKRAEGEKMQPKRAGACWRPGVCSVCFATQQCTESSDGGTSFNLEA